MTRGVPRPDLRQEAIRLRVEDRKSLKEIQAILGVSVGSLSPWLKPYPLTEGEIQQKKFEKSQTLHGSYTRTRELRGDPAKTWLLAKGLNAQQMAHLAEAAIQFRLVLHGFRSFRSCFEGDRADFLVLDGVRPLRIQVKSVMSNSSGKGLPTIQLQRNSGKSAVRYTSEEIDFIVGYWAYNDVAYVYALSELKQLAAKAISSDGVERWDKLRA